MGELTDSSVKTVANRLEHDPTEAFQKDAYSGLQTIAINMRMEKEGPTSVNNLLDDIEQGARDQRATPDGAADMARRIVASPFMGAACEALGTQLRQDGFDSMVKKLPCVDIVDQKSKPG